MKLHNCQDAKIKTAEQYGLSRMVADGGQSDGLVPFFSQKQPKSASDKTKLKAELVKSEPELVKSETKLVKSEAELVKSVALFVRKMVKKRHLLVECSKMRQFRHEFV
jgi:hypothetical protein